MSARFDARWAATIDSNAALMIHYLQSEKARKGRVTVSTRTSSFLAKHRGWFRRHVQFGSSRVVIILDNVVLKFGIRPVRLLRDLCTESVSVLRILRDPHLRTRRSLRVVIAFVLRNTQGIHANLIERRLDRTPLRGVIARTYWSCFGIVNVAERLSFAPHDDEIIKRIHAMHADALRLWERHHHDDTYKSQVAAAHLDHVFAWTDNFGLCDGRLILLDYGCAALEDLVVRAPDDLVRILSEECKPEYP